MTSAGFYPGDTPYYARLPVLFTVNITRSATLTPRAGVGATIGAPKFYAGNFVSLDRGTRDPFLEGGVTLIVPVTGTLRVALEAYVLNAPRDDLTTGGLGFGLLF